jgi:hypothetical protein
VNRFGWAVLIWLLAGCGPAPVLEDYSFARGYGGETRLRAEVHYAAGELRIGPSLSGGLFEMNLRYDPSRFRPIGVYRNDNGGTVRIGAEMFKKGGFRIGRRRAMPQRAEIAFATQPALELDILVGAADAELELGGLRLSTLHMATGASRTNLGFGSPNPGNCTGVNLETGAGDLMIRSAGNSGCPTWRFDGGVGKVTVDLGGEWRGDPRFLLNLAVGGVEFLAPRGMGVRVRMAGVVAKFTGDGFIKNEKTWTSEGFDQALRKADIEVNSAVGGVRVRWVDG